MGESGQHLFLVAALGKFCESPPTQAVFFISVHESLRKCLKATRRVGVSLPASEAFRSADSGEQPPYPPPPVARRQRAMAQYLAILRLLTLFCASNLGTRWFWSQVEMHPISTGHRFVAKYSALERLQDCQKSPACCRFGHSASSVHARISAHTQFCATIDNCCGTPWHDVRLEECTQSSLFGGRGDRPASFPDGLAGLF